MEAAAPYARAARAALVRLSPKMLAAFQASASLPTPHWPAEDLSDPHGFRDPSSVSAVAGCVVGCCLALVYHERAVPCEWSRARILMTDVARFRALLGALSDEVGEEDLEAVSRYVNDPAYDDPKAVAAAGPVVTALDAWMRNAYDYHRLRCGLPADHFARRAFEESHAAFARIAIEAQIRTFDAGKSVILSEGATLRPLS